MTNIFSRARFSTRHLISGEDINRILNAIDCAAILFDKESHEIYSANSKTLELTAYTYDELAAMSIDELIKGDIDRLLVPRHKKQDETLPRLELSARANRQIIVSVSVESLGEKSPWGLITLEEVILRKQRKIYSSFVNDLLSDYLIALIDTIHLSNPELAFDELLSIGQEILPDSNFAIYIGQSNEPNTQLLAAIGENAHILPEVIGPPDLLHLLQPSIWLKGQRSIVTLVHQSVRAEGFDYLASAPIKDSKTNNSWLGLMIAYGINPRHDHSLEILELLASCTATIIHKTMLVKNLRDSISKSNQQLYTWEAVQENIKDGIITISQEATIKSINPAAELIFGFADREVQKQPIENIIIGADSLHSAIKSSLQGIATPTLGTEYLHRRDGTVFPAELEINPIKNDKGVIGTMIFVRDQSEDEQIRTKTQQLEQRALLGEVTAIFAHEVRNPINNISMGLQLLDRNLDSENPERERIKNMQEECLRLTRLMDSVLTFSRTGNYAMVPVDITDLLQRILKRWRPRFTKVDIEYDLQSPDDLNPALGDMRSLEQVFTNIISNAVNVMKDSGGTFTVKVSEMNSNGNKSMIQIDLTDSGPGIPEENQHKVFDPFYTTNSNGTGLGLSISKQIIMAHKGNITLTSFPGATSFQIQLPTTNKMEDPIQ